MSLRTKLFLLFGVLMALLSLAQWWLVRSLTQQAYQDFGEAVVAVSQEVADLLQGDLMGLAKRLQQDGRVEQVRVVKRKQEKATDSPDLPQIVEGEDLKNHFQVEERLLSGQSPEGRTLTSSQKIEFRYDSGQPSSQMSLRIQGEGIDRTIELPSQGLQSSLGQLSSRLLYGTLAILAAGLAFAAVLAGRVSRPLKDLSQAAQGVASGRLGLQVPGKADQSGGEVGQAIQAFNRMSRQLQSYEESRRAWEERRHLFELGEIARGLAHTIRNPLNALGLSVEELAARKPSDPEATELAASARRQIRRIDHWIRSFLTLASQEGQYSCPVRLQALLEDILLEVVQDFKARVHLKEPSPALPEILGVEAELRGIIQALAVNAAEAAGEGGNVWIEAHSASEDSLRIEVRDDGPGLPAEVRERLFTPHVTTKPWGSGMGIYLAHRIAATRYEGKLEFEEGDPAGTKAVLTLKTKRAEEFHAEAQRGREAEEEEGEIG